LFERAYEIINGLVENEGGAPPVLFWLTAAVVFAASFAWVFLVTRLLRALKAASPQLYRQVLSPLPWSWTLPVNPLAIARILSFVLFRRYEHRSDPRVAAVGAQLRTTALIVAVGWLVLILLLVAVGPERLAA